MKKINKKGFSKIEFITMFGVLAILIAIGSKMAVGTGKNYSGFKVVVRNFLSSVSTYKDKYHKNSNQYYLYELIEKGYSHELKNPLKSDEKCDMYETYANIATPNDKKVYLICGNYLVEGSQKKGYEVYELSEWSEVQDEDHTESAKMYNYKENGVLVFPEYYLETTFIQKYFEKNKKLISSPSELGSDLEVKNLYRKKTLVKELK